MKYSEYSEYPPTFIPYTNTETLVNYNVVKETKHLEDDNSYDSYKCESIIVNTVDKDSIVDAMIRNRYTLSQELAVLRQRDTKPDEYKEYNDYAEYCKLIALEILTKVI